ncbi:hypothetical protein M513_11074 [Trichuris suis]|uniref:Uncharacterized protein n=1 Tax=Trichuris suis TaxID=68888 RepID=A0A085LSV8_9BILA|nr:hypothetical protein M513_11074 [Trichuris suis]
MLCPDMLKQMSNIFILSPLKLTQSLCRMIVRDFGPFCVSEFIFTNFSAVVAVDGAAVVYMNSFLIPPERCEDKVSPSTDLSDV